MINLREAARKFLKDLKKNGLNGIPFFGCYLEGSDTPEDDLTVEQQDEINRNYVIFIAEPDLEYYCEPAPYVLVDIDYESFNRDFRDALIEELGSDIDITHYSGCNEWEITRKGFVWPTNE